MPSPSALRSDAQILRTRLAEIGLDVPDACLPGVSASLVVLRDHMSTLRQLPLNDRIPLALDYRP